MNPNRKNRLDDTLSFMLVAAAAVLAVGLQVATSLDYKLDRGSVQAHRQQKDAALRVAAAASEAAKARELSIALGRP